MRQIKNMKRYLIGSILALIVIFSVSAVGANQPTYWSSVITKGGQAISVPVDLRMITPNVFYLGQTIHDGYLVEGYMFVNRAKGGNKGGSNGGGDSKCYSISGYKWNNIEDYIVDTTNNAGLDPYFISENIAYDISKWETAAGKNILGYEVEGTVDGLDYDASDNKNEFMFGSLDDGIIGINLRWTVVSFPKTKQIIEWDIMLNENYDWATDGSSSAMDFESITTHELGHSFGMGDLYGGTCSEQTMYGYAGYGETKKRTLESGDITGIKRLYR